MPQCSVALLQAAIDVLQWQQGTQEPSHICLPLYPAETIDRRGLDSQLHKLKEAANQHSLEDLPEAPTAVLVAALEDLFCAFEKEVLGAYGSCGLYF